MVLEWASCCVVFIFASRSPKSKKANHLDGKTWAVLPIPAFSVIALLALLLEEQGTKRRIRPTKMFLLYEL